MLTRSVAAALLATMMCHAAEARSHSRSHGRSHAAHREKAAEIPPGKVPDCAAQQIALALDDRQGEFVGMSQNGTLLVLHNVSRAACRVPGLPQIRFGNAEHPALPIIRKVELGMRPGPVVPPVVLKPGATVSAQLRWVAGDVFPGGTCFSPDAISVAMAGSAVTHPFKGSLCGPAGRPATFSQGWLGPYPPS